MDVPEPIRSLSPKGIIDCYVNGHPKRLKPYWETTSYLFGRSNIGDEGEDADDLVASMDRHGIAKALLAPPPYGELTPEEGYRWTLETVQKYPERFGLSVRVDPQKGMAAVRELESLVRNDGAIALRLVPFRVGKPLTHRVYYPLYTKCVELGIPVTSTVGIPGPLVPGLVPNPKNLDTLCYVWPELTVVTTHGGEPWTGLLVKLLLKWPNLFHMISAFSPKYYPADTLKFLSSSRGRQKVMFATDYPLISFARALEELPRAPIATDSWAPFLYENADRVFWKGPGPESGKEAI